MTLESIITIGITILSIVIAPIVYIWKNIMSRLDNLEKQQVKIITKEEARELIDDKIDSMKEDMVEIKVRLDKIIDRLINKE